jgi:hypothetical protein
MVVNAPRNGAVSEKLIFKRFSTCLFLGMMLIMICNAVRLAAIAPAEGLASEAVGGMDRNDVKQAKETVSETQSGRTGLLTCRRGIPCDHNGRQKSVCRIQYGRPGICSDSWLLNSVSCNSALVIGP